MTFWIIGFDVVVTFGSGILIGFYYGQKYEKYKNTVKDGF